MKQAGALAGRLLAGGVIMLLPVPAVSTILIGSLVKLEVMKVEERLRKSHAEPLKTLKAQHMQASDMVHNMLRQHAHSVSSSDSYFKLLNHPRIKDYFESVSVRVVHVTTYGELMARAAVLPSPSGKKPG